MKKLILTLVLGMFFITFSNAQSTPASSKTNTTKELKVANQKTDAAFTVTENANTTTTEHKSCASKKAKGCCPSKAKASSSCAGKSKASCAGKSKASCSGDKPKTEAKKTM